MKNHNKKGCFRPLGRIKISRLLKRAPMIEKLQRKKLQGSGCRDARTIPNPPKMAQIVLAQFLGVLSHPSLEVFSKKNDLVFREKFRTQEILKILA